MASVMGLGRLRSDARRQAWKNRRCIHCNASRIFRAEHDADGLGSFAPIERSMADRLLGA